MVSKANLGNRFIAILLDTILVGILAGIVGAVVGQSVLGISVGFIVGMIYNWYFWTRNRGQTPGKMLLGVRVVSKDGGPISDVQAVIRYIGYYINTFFLFIGWIWAAFDDRGQGWHDKLAGTYVEKA
jgi:uncharacterized RDD family membrane protein YckC